MQATSQLPIANRNLTMDERTQRRNALLIVVFSALVTAASFYTGRPAVLLAGELQVHPPPPSRGVINPFSGASLIALVCDAGQGIFICVVGSVLVAVARGLYARHRGTARAQQGRAGKAVASAATLLSRNPLKKQPRPATSEEDRRRRAEAAQAR